MTNETLQTLVTRRSIRRFKPEQIKDEELKAVLEAGMYAPSAANQQSAILIVIQNKDMLRRIAALNASVFGRDTNPYYNAPCVILVLADNNKIAPIEDASLALGNILNAAHSLGLGSCWIHREKEMFEKEEGKALLKEWGVKGNYMGVGACILGYPEGEPPKAAPRKEGYVIMVK